MSSEFAHDGFEGAFVVLEQARELSILLLERLILLDEGDVQSLQFGLEFLCDRTVRRGVQRDTIRYANRERHRC